MSRLVTPISEVTLALTASYLLAASSFFLGRLAPRWRLPSFVLLSSLLLACPLLVSAHRSLLRGSVAGIAAFLWLKAWDASWSARQTRPRALPHFLMHLLNFGWLVGAAPGDRLPKQVFPPRVFDFVSWSVGFGGTVLALYWAFTTEWARLPFLAEHCVKAAIVLLFLLCGFNCHAAMWRLVGVASLSSPLSILLAACPAEFWRRWNRPAGRWFAEHVFKRVGGVKRPLVATLITFAVSGFIHGYIAAMFAGRVTGYPTAFFLVQGCAAAATLRVRVDGWKYAAAATLTWVFNVISSVLLFAPLDAGISFYDNGLPGWL